MPEVRCPTNLPKLKRASSLEAWPKGDHTPAKRYRSCSPVKSTTADMRAAHHKSPALSAVDTRTAQEYWDEEVVPHTTMSTFGNKKIYEYFKLYPEKLDETLRKIFGGESESPERATVKRIC